MGSIPELHYFRPEDKANYGFCRRSRRYELKFVVSLRCPMFAPVHREVRLEVSSKSYHGEGVRTQLGSKLHRAVHLLLHDLKLFIHVGILDCQNKWLFHHG